MLLTVAAVVALWFMLTIPLGMFLGRAISLR